MNALLKTEQVSKPLDGPKNTNTFAGNAETASKGAENKAKAAERGADQLVKKASDIAAKMSPQEIAGMQPKGDGLAGPAIEMGLHATGHNMAAAAVAVATVSTGQGQGTYSTEKTASKPILSKVKSAPSPKRQPLLRSGAAGDCSTDTANQYRPVLRQDGQRPGLRHGPPT